MMLTAVLIAAVLPLAGCKKPTTMKEKVGYAVGQDIGRNLAGIKDEIDLGCLKRGLDDFFAGRPSELSPDEIQQVMQDFQASIMAKKGGASPMDAAKNLQEGKDFLAKNAKAPGVKVTASGLQYQVLKAGTGANPKATDTVKVHYRGMLLNGKEFDSSYKRNEPATFPVKGVIPGWTEALQLMKAGGKYKLVIPSNLAYGERGAGGDIGPNSTLIFEVELLQIVK
jgi:FKBP-type peptidyl-prolyl cis-trans isomerase